jgi:hypothetical protein
MFPSYIMSTDFLTHFRVPIPCVPRYGEKNLSYLVLRVFTLPSIPGKNPLTLVVKVLRDALVLGISCFSFYFGTPVLGNIGVSNPSIAAPIPPHRVGGWGISEV